MICLGYAEYWFAVSVMLLGIIVLSIYSSVCWWTSRRRRRKKDLYLDQVGR